MQPIYRKSALLAICLQFFAASAALAASTPEYVAYVEKVYPPVQSLARVISITRDGHSVPVANNADLAGGDEVRVLDDRTAVVIRTVATRALTVVRHYSDNHSGAPDIVIARPPARSLFGAAFSFMKLTSLTASEANSNVAASSRSIPPSHTCFNDGGKTNEPIKFDVPALAAERSYLSQGERQIFVSWHGGVPPFSVVLADVSSDAIVSRTDNVSDGCQTWLSNASIVAGKRYRLAVVDANGIREEDNDVFGVLNAPTPPKILIVNGAIPTDLRLYYSTWLTLLGRGEWTLEATQLVAAMGCNAPGVVEWLGSIVQSGECHAR